MSSTFQLTLWREYPPPAFNLFLLQACIIAPVTTAILAFTLGTLLIAPLLRLLTTFMPFYLLEDFEDIKDAMTILCAGLIAGILVAIFVPAFRRTGRWIWVFALIMAACIPSFREYRTYDERATLPLTVTSYLCDSDCWLIYGYVGYAVGLLLGTIRSRTKQPNTNRRFAAPILLTLCIVAIVYRQAGPPLASQQSYDETFFDHDEAIRQGFMDVKFRATSASVEDFLKNRQTPFTLNRSAKSLDAYVTEPHRHFTVTYFFDNTLKLKSINVTPKPPATPYTSETIGHK